MAIVFAERVATSKFSLCSHNSHLHRAGCYDGRRLSERHRRPERLIRGAPVEAAKDRLDFADSTPPSNWAFDAIWVQGTPRHGSAPMLCQTGKVKLVIVSAPETINLREDTVSGASVRLERGHAALDGVALSDQSALTSG